MKNYIEGDWNKNSLEVLANNGRAKTTTWDELHWVQKKQQPAISGKTDRNNIEQKKNSNHIFAKLYWTETMLMEYFFSLPVFRFSSYAWVCWVLSRHDRVWLSYCLINILLHALSSEQKWKWAIHHLIFVCVHILSVSISFSSHYSNIWKLTIFSSFKYLREKQKPCNLWSWVRKVSVSLHHFPEKFECRVFK